MTDDDSIRSFYDHVYHGGARVPGGVPWYLRRLASRLGPWDGKRLLDLGCGLGQWLAAARQRGARVTGIDISRVALQICRKALPQAHLLCAFAEDLPLKDRQFDLVSCLGSLEHFVDPEAVIREMVRVAGPGATFLFLVPNADFLTRRLGLFRGTEQARLREEVKTLSGWQDLFESSGLRVTRCWRDLHLLSWSWICHGKWYLWLLRAAQAVVLPFWPLSWQYQVYFLCRRRD